MEILRDANSVLTLVQNATAFDLLVLDSYGSVSRGNIYFNNRLRSGPWDDSSTIDKTKALVEATRIIDSLNFCGKKAVVGQLHQFPRSTIGGYDDVSGTTVEAVADATVPQEVEFATYEIAIKLLDDIDPDLEINNLAKESQGFSTARSTYNRQFVLQHLSAGVPSARAWALLKPFLRNNKEIQLCRVS